MISGPEIRDAGGVKPPARSSVQHVNQSPDKDLIGRTRAIWQSRTGRDVTRNEAQQIVANVTGFFAVLAEWSRAETSASIMHSVEKSTSEAKEARDDS